MSFVHAPFLIWNMIRHAGQIKLMLDDLKYIPPKGYDPLEEGDYVEKITGDYHIKGYVIGIATTRLTKKPLYVVEHTAEGGGSFSHIYSRSNLALIRRYDVATS